MISGFFPRSFPEYNSEADLRFPAKTTEYYASLIETHDGKAVLAQLLPTTAELLSEGVASIDPLGEREMMPFPGAIHKYENRLLVLISKRCFVHCRHCNRRHFHMSDQPEAEIGPTVDYLRAHPEIRDVILSGGDALALPPEELEQWLKSVRSIDCVRLIRLGTRAPVVAPEIINESLVKTLARYRPIAVQTQFNHPVEITSRSEAACRRLIESGIQVNNQAVLLKGVNDDLEVIEELSWRLLEIGVRFYYLFNCEPVMGALHFRVPIVEAIDFSRRLRKKLSNVIAPRFVDDSITPDQKMELSCVQDIEMQPDGVCSIRYQGDIFRYRELALQSPKL